MRSPRRVSSGMTPPSRAAAASSPSSSSGDRCESSPTPRRAPAAMIWRRGELLVRSAAGSRATDSARPCRAAPRATACLRAGSSPARRDRTRRPSDSSPSGATRCWRARARRAASPRCTRRGLPSSARQHAVRGGPVDVEVIADADEAWSAARPGRGDVRDMTDECLVEDGVDDGCARGCLAGACGEVGCVPCRQLCAGMDQDKTSKMKKSCGPSERRVPGQALFVQIAGAIATDIRRGVLRAGDRLPSTRALAAIAGRQPQHRRRRVRRARRAGLGDVARCGRHVRRQRAARSSRPATAKTVHRASPGYELACAVRGTLRRVIADARVLLSAGVPDPRLFPRVAMSPARIAERCASQGVEHGARYADPQGALRLRAAIAAMLRETRAVPGDRENVLITRGSQMALDLAARAAGAARRSRRRRGARLPAGVARVRGCRRDASSGRRSTTQGLVVDELPHSVRCRLHDAAPPVSDDGADAPAAAPRAARRAPAATASRSSRTTTITSSTSTAGRCRRSRATDVRRQVIYIGSLSKILAPGLRLGFVGGAGAGDRSARRDPRLHRRSPGRPRARARGRRARRGWRGPAPRAQAAPRLRRPARRVRGACFGAKSSAASLDFDAAAGRHHALGAGRPKTRRSSKLARPCPRRAASRSRARGTSPSMASRGHSSGSRSRATREAELADAVRVLATTLRPEKKQ